MGHPAQRPPATSTVIVGIGDGAFSASPAVILRTFGLGSCVGICLLDPESGVSGMVHVALSDSKLNTTLAKERPFHFADTAVPLAVSTMIGLGASRRRPTWRVKLAGGASVLANSSSFDIGKRNQLAIKRCLWANGMAPIAEHCGGSEARTLTMTVGNPDVEVYLGHRERIVI